MTGLIYSRLKRQLIEARWLEYLALFLVVLGARLWLVFLYGSPVPFMDQWDGEGANLFKPWLEGTLRISDLFQPHNEHRIVLSRLLALGLLAFNGQWDAQLEMAVNALLCGTMAVLIAVALVKLFGPDLRTLITLVVGLWSALPYGHESTLWAFESSFYFLLFFSLLAIWGLDLLKKVAENILPRVREISLDVNVLLFAVGLSLITGIILGLVPALHASRSDPIDSLKDSSRGSTGRQAGRLRAGLLVAEVALSLVLVVGAVLLVDSFRRLQNVDPGFRAAGVTTFFVGLPPGSYPDIERQGLFFQNAIEKLKALPGVTNAATGANLPASDNGNTRSPAAVEGRPLPPVSDRMIAVRSTISPGFLETLGIPIKQGRDFNWRDRPNTPMVVIINESMAKKFFPGENPIGHRLITGIQSIPREIVGVSGDVRAENLSLPPGVEMYYPSTQLDGAFQSIVVRSERPAASLRSELIAAIHSLDPGLPIDEVQSYTEVLSQASADRRLSMYLLGGFAGLALALAGMGIYSVIAYGVAQRTNEFGIRFALGAAARDVIGLVMKEGLRLSIVGLVVGLGLSFAVTRLMQRLLFEVSPSDPWLYSGVALFICAIAALACFVPALRATRIDPMQALRTE
jgi:predicted permease